MRCASTEGSLYCTAVLVLCRRAEKIQSVSIFSGRHGEANQQLEAVAVIMQLVEGTEAGQPCSTDQSKHTTIP